MTINNYTMKDLKELILQCEATKDEGLCEWCPLHFACCSESGDGIIQFTPIDGISKWMSTGIVYRGSPNEI